MYSIKIIAHCASKKSVLASVIKVAGIFKSTVATGNIAILDGQELPAVGTILELPGITKVSTLVTTTEDGKEFTWLALD
jgi:hypothetical protein